MICCSWSINIYISLCGCRRNWAAVPLGEHNSMGTQSKYFLKPIEVISLILCWLVEGAKSLLMLLGDGYSFCTKEPAFISVLNEKMLLNVHSWGWIEHQILVKAAGVNLGQAMGSATLQSCHWNWFPSWISAGFACLPASVSELCGL